MSLSAAETVANIEELLTTILVSLPPRPLVRFKSVSKHWLTLISDPAFLRRHTQQNLKISGFFSSKTEDKSFKAIPLGHDEIPSGNPFKIINDSFSDGTTLKIIQSCNGLFLCLRYSCLPRYVANDVAYVVNPTTNQYLALSSPSAEGTQGFCCGTLCFGF
uniref:F-box protein At5g07610-like n=1 Tax=Fragaria vesca subsp. vesca TaxID=101020 RepID=UPI0005CAB895|nr:PREDICTED: F-box protein At5g07610-like [Fragaria vesca subsp. vesca]